MSIFSACLFILFYWFNYFVPNKTSWFYLTSHFSFLFLSLNGRIFQYISSPIIRSKTHIQIIHKTYLKGTRTNHWSICCCSLSTLKKSSMQSKPLFFFHSYHQVFGGPRLLIYFLTILLRTYRSSVQFGSILQMKWFLQLDGAAISGAIQRHDNMKR